MLIALFFDVLRREQERYHTFNIRTFPLIAAKCIKKKNLFNLIEVQLTQGKLNKRQLWLHHLP